MPLSKIKERVDCLKLNGLGLPGQIYLPLV